ncbi:hypothetical protein EG349_19860 (plasmid) [Chryseobacterium shandongense]|jgi:hypothetical protein|uniref:Uncharacterized protein n=1 Tax=Chryseobacterium shandongense TaxID=1493872 RepID=A0AAD0YHE5_9FLAO|nr:hypothetical protein [Chryseobacterium shandongense]AZA89084.1 hypothetical protein EG349_19860 [Chryseobacterium shandongense]AZA98067.1 hypothetical protein EG353_21000 [Chryseobacterium shandongense]
MLKNTIKLSDDTKDLLDQIQLKFGLKTYDTTVNTCSLFIIRNEINLKEDYIGDYRKGLVDLEKRLTVSFKEHEDKMKLDNASVRKWMGGIEKDYLKPLIQKLSILDKISDLGINNILQEKQNIPKIESPLNSHLEKPFSSSSEDQENTEKLKNELQDKDQKFRDLYNKYETQKQALFKIFNNSKVESGGMLSKEKIVINLTYDEWEELKRTQ